MRISTVVIVRRAGGETFLHPVYSIPSSGTQPLLARVERRWRDDHPQLAYEAEELKAVSVETVLV